MPTVKFFVDDLTAQFKRISTSPRLDAELLVARALQKTRTQLLAYPETVFTIEEAECLKQLATRRLQGEPIAYILGQQEFWGLELEVNDSVLIPRPETELLVAWVLDHFPAAPSLRLADLGTGSGAIALAIASERPHWFIDASDQSHKALAVARRNAARLGITNVHFYLGDWCSALPNKNYHVIVANPPYIRENDPHLLDLTYEPKTALVANEAGLAALRKIILEARDYLVKDGWLILEHGYDQQQPLLELMQQLGYRDVQDKIDLQQLPRMIIGKK